MMADAAMWCELPSASITVANVQYMAPMIEHRKGVLPISTSRKTLLYVS